VIKRFDFGARDADGSKPMYVREADYAALEAQLAESQEELKKWFKSEATFYGMPYTDYGDGRRSCVQKLMDDIAQLRSEVVEFKELAETQAASAEKGWNRVRELEAALLDIAEGNSLKAHRYPHELAAEVLKSTSETACEHDWRTVTDVCDRSCNGTILGWRCWKCDQFDGTKKAPAPQANRGVK
jgi:hypothetical protein